MNAQQVDTLITDGLVLSLEPDAAPIDSGWVAVRNGAIVDLGSGTGRPAGIQAEETIDAAGCLVMPGLVNSHVHGAMALFRGLADDLPLMTWLNEHIFPAESNHVNEDLVYWGTRLACAEMLLSGTTCFADGYFLEDQASRAVLDTGMRAVLGQGVIDFPAPGVPDPNRNVENAREFLARWQGASPLLSPAVFCHSPYTCSPETLIRGKALARETGTIFQIHLAETSAEVEQIRSERGLTPARYLESLDLLDDHTLAVHCVHLDDDEVALLAQHGTSAVVCVESQMKLASGVAPIPQMLAQGVNVALGTDGPASNNDLNLFGEMRSLALLFKAVGLDPTVLPASQTTALAGPAGAQALGMADKIGILAPGFRADLIILELNRPHLKPLYHPYSHLVYSATGREIRHVLVDGRVLVRNGRPTLFDLTETMQRCREIAVNIRSRLGEAI